MGYAVAIATALGITAGVLLADASLRKEYQPLDPLRDIRPLTNTRIKLHELQIGQNKLVSEAAAQQQEMLLRQKIVDDALLRQHTQRSGRPP